MGIAKTCPTAEHFSVFLFAFFFIFFFFIPSSKPF